MKLNRVSFANLNSLAGTWSIDFASQAFEDGLFLITGETGSGKTTILDAVSLALYGRTAREKVTKDLNEVMTRGCGFAWAEAEFSTAGGRFRARWEQQRARGRAAGKLQSVRMSLYDCVNDKDVSAHRAGDTLDLIASNVGLSFEQFQRTMMLAQGQFDRFLTAKESERSEVLQQATGTEIYARVGDGINRAKKAAEDAVSLLKARMLDVKVLDDAARAELESGWRERRERAEALESRLDVAQKQLLDYLRRKSDVSRATDAAAGRRLILDETARAAGEMALKLESARKVVDGAEDALKTADPLVDRALALHQDLTLAEQDRRAKASLGETAKEALEAARRKMSEIESNVERERTVSSCVEAVLAGRALDVPSVTVPALAAILDEARAYAALRDGFSEKEREVIRLEESVGTAAAHVDEVMAKYKILYPARKEALENARLALELAKVVDRLEHHRKGLQDGKPCPLCGSLDHPYARGNVPEKSRCQLAYEAARQAVDELDDWRNAALEARASAESARAAAVAAFAREKSAHDALQGRLSDARVSLRSKVESDESTLRGVRAELEGLEADVVAKEAVVRAAAGNCAGVRKQIADLGLPDNPQAYRKTLQAACDRAKADFVKIAQEGAALEANVDQARAEADKANGELAAAQEAFDALLATVPEPDKLEAEVASLKAEKSALDTEIGGAAARLALDDANRKNYEAMLADLESKETACHRWRELDRWLGGVGGEKFKRYAQGITLRQLLSYANPHLAAMTQGRYEMSWDPEARDAEKLLPFIVDRDQGGERRPVTNLSGGERFQVSLALALGLSEMSSARLSVDSLFLDEGFGTLDGKALEAALDTLCRIQQDGKLIGIISHVAEIGERISTQIAVRKVGGGFSILSGAGVNQPMT